MNRRIVRAETSLAVRWLLWLFFVIVGLLVLIAFAAGLFALRWWAEQQAAAAAVEKEVARLRASVEPMTVADLYRFHALPPGVNDSTPAWLAAMKSYDPARLNQDAQGLPYVGDAEPSVLESKAGRLAAEKFLQDHDSTIQTIVAAAREPGECRFPYQFELGFSGVPAEVRDVRTLIRLLALSAHVHVLNGDLDRAVQSLAAMYAASETLDHQLTIVEHQIRLATLSVAMQQTELVVNELSLTRQQRSTLTKCLESCDVPGSFTRSLIGERALGYNAFLTASPVARSPDCQKYLEFLATAIALSSEPLPAGRDSFQAAVEQFTAEQNNASAWSRNEYFLTANVLNSLGRAFDACAKCEARRNELIDKISQPGVSP